MKTGPLAQFHPLKETALGEQTAFYSGCCPISGSTVRLPRTTLSEEIALAVAADLRLDEGKMIGVLVVRDGSGQLGYAKAYSGELDPPQGLTGWVPPLHFVSMPNEALGKLDCWKSELAELSRRLEDHPYLERREYWQRRRSELAKIHRAAKAERDGVRQRGDGRTEEALQEESRRHSRERRLLRRESELELDRLQDDYRALKERWDRVKRDRRTFSRDLQARMHRDFSDSVASLLGCRLERIFANGLPTGTGECCAPKLIGWAAKQGYTPLALAEVWAGPDSAKGRHAGEFYLACKARCQPLLGPLLARALRDPIKVLYSDAHLLVVDKPSGLLTVAGRYPWSQECVLTQFDEELYPVHRLDLETSGVLLLARDPQTLADLQKQFADRQVIKVYQALLDGRPVALSGRIERPLGPVLQEETTTVEGDDRPRHAIRDDGKEAITEFLMLNTEENRIEFRPLTGRSHQLRVHAADVLGCAIRGDALYGEGGERLKLHAVSLTFCHPRSGEPLTVESTPPF